MSKKLLILVILVLGSIPNIVSLSFDFAQDSELVELSNYAFGQSVDTAWVRRYNGPGNSSDYAYAIAVDGSGNVYVTGESYGSGTDYDYATIKYDPAGNQLWVQRYNGPANSSDDARAIAVDGSGNVYVTGGSWSSGTFSKDYATIKYDLAGNQLWEKRYNGPGNSDDVASAIAVDGSGNVYVTGVSEGSGTHEDYATIKYDPDGNQLWEKRYNGPANNHDYAWAIAVDGSGNVYVTGWSSGSGTSDDYATLKYDPAGNQFWVQRYNGPGNSIDWARAIAVDGSGNVYVTGWSSGSGTFNNYATLKYDLAGNQLWVQTYNGPGNGDDGASAIAVDGSGNVYVTGYIYSSGMSLDYATIKYVQTPGEVKDETGNREKPSEFTLSQNYPNPFNQSTKIEFTLSQSGFVNLNIYDLLGRKVRTLVSENLSPGYKSVFWDGKDNSGKEVASGIYFYRLKIGDYSEAKRLVLLK